MIVTITADRPSQIDQPAVAARIVRGALEGVAAGHPLIVSIREAWSHEVLVGLERNRGFIQIASGTGEPPYWARFNAAASRDSTREVVDFFLHGEHHTPIPIQRLIPAGVLWPALDAFLAAGVRSPKVEWRMV